MTGDERRPHFGNSAAGLTPRSHLLLLRPKTTKKKWWKHRRRISAVLGAFLCICVALVFQEWACLQSLNIVHQELETTGIPYPDLPYSPKSSKRRNPNPNPDPDSSPNPIGEDVLVLQSPPYASARVIRDTKEGASDRDSGNLQGAAIAILVFRFPNNSGQGTGNILSGALAAQMLAEEFNRTLCHCDAGAGTANVRSSFDRAFEWRDRRHKDVCDRILRPIDHANKTNGTVVQSTSANTIVQQNYDTTSEQSECAMRDLLWNHGNFPIVYYEGNTYPRWPNKDVSVPRDYFHERFQPTQALRDVLPWKEPPLTVVHLRKGDNAADHRGGLDNRTLSLLTRVDFLDDSNSDTKNTVFLVTNNVEWYARFPEWSHPNWNLVHHSALKRISWGGRGNHDRQPHNENRNEGDGDGDGDLQMWADWYTLINAQTIYHTFSDFSRSASRWNEKIQSWTILGWTNETTTVMKEGAKGPRLELRNDIEVLPNASGRSVSKLVDRTAKELWFCGIPSLEEKNHVQEKKDEQLLALIQARKRKNGSRDDSLQNYIQETRRKQYKQRFR